MGRTLFFITLIYLLALNLLTAQDFYQGKLVHTDLRHMDGRINPDGYTDALSFSFYANTNTQRTSLTATISKFMGADAGISPLLLSIEGRDGDQIDGIVVRVNGKPYGLDFAGGSVISSTSKVFFFALNTAILEAINRAKNLSLVINYTPLYSGVSYSSSQLKIRNLDELKYNINLMESIRPITYYDRGSYYYDYDYDHRGHNHDHSGYCYHDRAYLFPSPGYNEFDRYKQSELQRKNREDLRKLDQSIAPVIYPPQHIHVHPRTKPYQQHDGEPARQKGQRDNKNKLSTSPIGVY